MQSNEVKWLPLKSLQPNTGQVPGLPGNPRQWTEGDIKRIARSLKETPELFVARPIIVLPYSVPGADDCYVILGGNLRSEGARRNKMQTVPCYILPTETPVAKLKEIVIKDNGSFGAWDYDALGNEWSDLPLPEWGVPAWDVEDGKEEDDKAGDVSPDQFGDTFQLPDGEKADARQMSFVLTNAQVALVQAAVDLSRSTLGELDGENQNEDGAALFEIIKTWSRSTLGELDGEEVTADLETAAAEVEGIRLYLRAALESSGRKASDVDRLLGTNGMSGHYFGASQWLLPTRAAYEKMKTIMQLPREYSDLFATVAKYKYFSAIVSLKDSLKDV